MKNQILSIMTLGLLIGLSACQNQNSKIVEQTLKSEEIIDIASKAYVYGYPLVLMEYTKRSITYIPEPNNLGAVPVNQFGHMRVFPDHTFTEVVKPNVDTYYSIAWMDLATEPLILIVPQTELYYLLPLLDAYTNVFSVPGTRTTGTDAHEFLITGPIWEGEIPEDMEQIASPTNMVWLLGRIQVNSPEDGQNIVWPIQDGMSLVPLSQSGKEYIPPQGISNEVNKDLVPVVDVRALSTSDFFNFMSSLMIDNPPFDRDSILIQEMASIGIIPGEKFNMSAFDSETQKSQSAASKTEGLERKNHPLLIRDLPLGKWMQLRPIGLPISFWPSLFFSSSILTFSFYSVFPYVKSSVYKIIFTKIT